MIELLKTIRVVGLRHTLMLYRAYRWGWMDTISGFFTTRTLQALFNVGFFDEMQAKGAVNIESFAVAKNLDFSILKSLCDSLFSLSILKKEGVEYWLDSKGQILVKVARGWFDGVYGYEVVFHSLEALLKKEKEYGKEVKRRPDYVARGSGEMEKWIYFPLAIDSITKNGFKSVLDLGCGDGTFLRVLCERNHAVRGYGIDIAPEAIAEGRERTQQAGLQERLRLFVEDISALEKAPEPLQGIEVATIFFVLHELLFAGTGPVIAFLQSFRRVFTGVPLLVFEVIRPTPEEMRQRPGMAIQYVLQHDISHQKLVGSQEWHDIFRTAGFSSIEERQLKFVRTAIFTLR